MDILLLLSTMKNCFTKQFYKQESKAMENCSTIEVTCEAHLGKARALTKGALIAIYDINHHTRPIHQLI